MLNEEVLRGTCSSDLFKALGDCHGYEGMSCFGGFLTITVRGPCNEELSALGRFCERGALGATDPSAQVWWSDQPVPLDTERKHPTV